jgi:adenine-specific DNA-methyltransferase
LRSKRIRGLRFRRQFSVGPYFADFVCLRVRLVIEVDGSQHHEPEQKRHDAIRTAWLRRQGFDVLRFDNGDVLDNADGVVSQIDRVVVERLKAIPPRWEGDR